MKKAHISISSALLLIFFTLGFSQSGHNGADYDHSRNPYYSHRDIKPLDVPDSEWKRILPQGLYHIAREQGVERVYTGKYWDDYEKGTYFCAICGFPLYSSTAKYDSHTGRPSFSQTITDHSVIIQKDEEGKPNEVVCARCHSHMGYLDEDPNSPTHKRYTMNGDVLDFDPGKPGFSCTHISTGQGLADK